MTTKAKLLRNAKAHLAGAQECISNAMDSRSGEVETAAERAASVSINKGVESWKDILVHLIEGVEERLSAEDANV